MCITILAMAIIPVNANQSKFTDIEGHWAEAVITKLQDAGYVEGYPDGTFRPNQPITRAELACMITKVFKLTEETGLDYTDIDGDWYTPYIKKAGKFIPVYALPENYPSNLIYTENDGTKFLPDTSALRMHTAEALAEAKIQTEKIKVEDLTIVEINERVRAVFKDGQFNLHQTPPPHSTTPQNLVRMNRYAWLSYELGIFIGEADGYFYPYQYMTRAQIVTAIDRIITIQKQ